jgi:hypothetical protein
MGVQISAIIISMPPATCLVQLQSTFGETVSLIHKSAIYTDAFGQYRLKVPANKGVLLMGFWKCTN